MNQIHTNIIVKLVNREMRKPKPSSERLVYLSPVLLWVGIICTVLFCIPGLVLPLVTGNWETWPFLCFASLGVILIIGYVNCRIWYDKEGFTVKYFLGYRRHFSYSEIESIQGNLRDVKLRVRGCTVRVDEAAIGKLEFLAFAKKQYRIHSGGKAIPKAKPKGDIFNGHVDNPSEFIFAYLLVLLFMPGMLLISFFSVKPTPMENLTFVTGVVEWTEVAPDDDTCLNIFSSGTVMEVWGYERTLSDPQEFLDACEAGESFTIGYRTVTNDSGDVTCLNAEYIEDSAGNIWITPEVARNHRFRIAAMMFGILEIIWLLFMGTSIYVGRNPHKFSKKVVRLFFKDGYVH